MLENKFFVVWVDENGKDRWKITTREEAERMIANEDLIFHVFNAWDELDLDIFVK